MSFLIPYLLAHLASFLIYGSYFDPNLNLKLLIAFHQSNNYKWTLYSCMRPYRWNILGYLDDRGWVEFPKSYDVDYSCAAFLQKKDNSKSASQITPKYLPKDTKLIKFVVFF